MFASLCRLLRELEVDGDKMAWGSPQCDFDPALNAEQREPHPSILIPGRRIRYLAEIAEQGRELNRRIAARAEEARRAQHYYEVLRELETEDLPDPLQRFENLPEDATTKFLAERYNEAIKATGEEGRDLLAAWPGLKASVESEEFSYEVRGREIRGDNYRKSLAGLKIPKVSPPKTRDWGDQLKFLMKEGLPGHYPYTDRKSTRLNSSHVASSYAVFSSK